MSLLDLLLKFLGASKPKPRPPEPPRVPTTRTIAVYVPNTPLADVSIQVAADQWLDGTTDTIGYVAFHGVSAYLGDSAIEINALGFKPYLELVEWRHLSRDLNLSQPLNHQVTIGVDLPSLAPDGPSTPPYVPQSGRLSTNGKQFIANGQIVRIQGASQFLLGARAFRGENVDAQFEWMKETGVNEAREFSCVPWGGEWEFWRRPEADPGWASFLRQWFGRFQREGIRLEYVCETFSRSTTDARRRAQAIYDIAQEYPLVTVQIGNEPHVNGIDTKAIYSGLYRRGVLSCAGDYLVPSTSGESGDGYLPADPDFSRVPMLDYGDLHSQRSLHIPAISSDRYPRNGKEALEFSDKTGRPWKDGEPLGLGEVNKDGSGARTTNTAAIVGHHALAAILLPGSCIHSQAGLLGLAPNPTESPIQHRHAALIGDIWRFVPAYAYTGTYARPHLQNWPMTWDSDQDSLVEHAYAMIHGNRAWACVPMPRDGWAPKGVNGWSVARTLDGWPNVVELAR